MKNANRGVPAPEPPLPALVRVRSGVGHLKWWLDLGQELPSWMTSMVLHLAIMILFASMAVKTGPHPNAVLVFDLSATMADPIDASLNAIEITPVEFTPMSISKVDPNTTFVNIEDPIANPLETLAAKADLTDYRDDKPSDDAVESVADLEESPTLKPDFFNRGQRRRSFER